MIFFKKLTNDLKVLILKLFFEIFYKKKKKNWFFLFITFYIFHKNCIKFFLKLSIKQMS